MDDDDKTEKKSTFDERVKDMLAKYNTVNSNSDADSDSSEDDEECTSDDSDSSCLTDSEDEESNNASESPLSQVLRWREERKEEKKAKPVKMQGRRFGRVLSYSGFAGEEEESKHPKESCVQRCLHWTTSS